MERRTNQPARLVESIGDFDGDFLGGIMANHEILQARSLEQPSEDVPIIPRSTGENALEIIGPDNFRGLPPSAVAFDASVTPEA